MGSLGADEGVVSRGKSYGCKFCGMVFSDGRVLGGHVRSHMAAAGLGRRSKKLEIDPGECSEGDGGGRSWGERGGYGLRDNRKKSWKFSRASEERGECSPRGKNQCGVCERGFRTSRALLGHMRLHSRKERGVEGSGHREMCCSDTEASVEEVMSDYERICSAKRKRRSVIARSDVIFPGKGMSLSSFLSGGTPGDEFKAAICLLMISRGITDSDLSGAVNNVWESSSPLVYTDDESEGSENSELEVGNNRRVGDTVDAAVELQEVLGCGGSFLILLNVEGKLMESNISFHIENRGIEVQSHQKGDILEIKHLAGDSVSEMSKLSVHDELGGEREKKLLPYSDSGKYPVPLKKLKEGYKCKSCGKIFAIHQALGGHRAKFKNGSCLTMEKNEKKIVDGKDSAWPPPPPEDKVVQTATVAKAALTEPDHKCPICGEVFSSGQALGGHKRRHYKKGSSSILIKKSADDVLLEVL